MIHIMNTNEHNWEQELTPLIEKYRKQEIDINVKVRVRNDQKIQQRSGKRTRLEDISYFTAYSYFSSLIDQAGLTRKAAGYHCVSENGLKKIDYLVEV